MEIEAKEIKRIEDGLHKGVITRIEYRTEPYEYTDVYIELEGFDGFELKSGYPTVITKDSALGKLLARFNTQIIPKQKYDVDKLLIGKQVQFLTTKIKNEDGKEYARIVGESVKPVI